MAVTAGQVVSVADITAGNLVFTPASNANGTGYATLTFSVRDSNNAYDTAPNTLTFDVTAVNDAPVNVVPGAQTVAVDTPLAISGLSITDVDGNLTTVQLSVTNGTLAMTVSGAATITSGGIGTSTITLSGTQADINATLGSLTYQGNSLFTGTDTLTVLSTDGNGATDTDTVAITVSNNAPTNVLPGPQTVAEDTPLAISGLSVTDADNNLTSVQLSVSHGALTLTLSGGAIISAGGNGSGSVTMSGTQAELNATLASLIYQGQSNYTGADTLTITSIDSTGTSDTDSVSITVTPVNDAPTDLGISSSIVAEHATNGTTVGSVTPTDPDSGDTFTYQLTDTAGGRFAINAATGEITVADGSLLHYEVASSHDVTVRVTDSGGLTYDKIFTIALTDINEAPTDLTLSSNTVVENATNGTVIGTVTGTDFDTGDSLTYSFTDSAGGRFAINSSTGQITVANSSLLDYESAASHTVTVRVTDSGGLTYDETFTINLTNVNETPTDLSLSANQVAENAANGTVVGTVSGTDPDSGDTKTYSFTDSAGGRFAINSSTGQITVADGSLLNYESATNHSVTVRVTDAGGLTYDETLTINLTNVNEAPTGADVTVTISEDTSHTLTTTNFGFSDVDAGDSLSAVRIDTIPPAGTLTLSGVAVTAGQVVTVADITAGNLVFTPSADANGTGYTSFTFSVRDSGNLYDTVPNVLTFDVTAVNDAPVNTVPGAQSVVEDMALTITGLSVTDVDGNLNTVQLAVGNGTLWVSLAGGVTISAGANDSGTLTLSGTEAQINAALATLTYQGALNFTGSDLLTMTSTDSNSVTDVDTVAITVTAVNDVPVITPIAPDITFVENGAAQVIDATGTITDVDSTNFDIGIMTVSVTQNGSVDDRLVVGNFGAGPGQVGTVGSTVTYGGVAIGTFSGGSSGSDPLVITFNSSASSAAVQEVYRSIQFNNVSESPSTATRQITFGLTDGDGGTATPQTKLVYVQAVNDAPVNTVPGAQSVAEDTLLSISGLSVTDVDGNLSTVQLGVSNGTLSVTLSGAATISAGANGSNTLTLSGSQADINATLATLTYQGIANFTGSDLLTLTSTDSNSGTDVDTVAITVTAVDDSTVVTGGTSGMGNEDTTIAGTLTATDADGLSDGTVFTMTGAASNGTASIDPATGLWSYTPNADYNGSDSFTVTITDDAGNTATQLISVTVSPVGDLTNDSLTTTEDTAISANVLTGTNGATADSFEGTPVLTGVTQGANGSVTFLANGTVTYTPNANFNGTDSFTYTITSGGVTETATVTVTVNAVNDPTIVTGGTSGTGNEDTTLTGSLTATDVEGLSDGTVFTVTGAATNGTASIDPATGLWSYTPNADYNGSDSFTVTITDDAGNTATQLISVTVSPVNDAPVLASNTGSAVAEGGTDTLNASELAVTDVDNSAAQLTYSIATGPAYGRLELTTAPGVSATTFTQADIAANRLVYVHDGSETTSDSFTFTVSDGAGGALGTTTMTLTITPVNDIPTITSDGGTTTASLNVAENVSAVTIVTGADVDLPAQALTYTISGGADQALFSINAATGALNFIAPPDFEVATDANGDHMYVVQVQVTDSQGASTTQTIQVTVTDVAETVASPSAAPTIPPVLLPTSPLESEKRSQPALTERNEAPASLSTPTTEQPSKPVETAVRSSGEVRPSVTPVEPPVFIKQEDTRRYETTKLEPVMPRWDDPSTPSPFTIVPVEPEQPIDSTPPDDQASLSDVLMAKLDAMTQSIEEAIGVEEKQEMVVVRVAALSGTALSVGFVAWAVQSSTLLASCLATLPVWRNFDPLPVVKLSKEERTRRRQAADAAQRQEQDEFGGLEKFF